MEILNSCDNPPLGLEWQVRRSLYWIDPADLVGLNSIHLNNEMPNIKEAGGAAEWSKRAQSEGAPVYGWYSPQEASSSAYIMLYVRPIYSGVPSFLWWSTVPTLRIVRTLAHEVAHHISAVRGYVFQPTEDSEEVESLANIYAANVLHRMTRRWHYKLGHLFLKEIAGWHYAFGSADWRHKKYRSAANHFFSAWDLNPEHIDAGRWYWRAREVCNSEPKYEGKIVKEEMP